MPLFDVFWDMQIFLDSSIGRASPDGSGLTVRLGPSGKISKISWKLKKYTGFISLRIRESGCILARPEIWMIEFPSIMLRKKWGQNLPTSTVRGHWSGKKRIQAVRRRWDERNRSRQWNHPNGLGKNCWKTDWQIHEEIRVIKKIFLDSSIGRASGC